MGLAVLAMVAASASAQGFEEMPVSANSRQARTPAPKSLQTVGVVPYELPAVVSPDDLSVQVPEPSQYQANPAIAHAVGNTAKGGIVQAQYQGESEWSSSQATLPSVRLVQGNVPRVASVEKSSPQTSPYQGPGQIITGDSDGTTPTVTRRPSSRTLPSPPPPLTTNPSNSPAQNQRTSSDGGIVNAYGQSDEIEWDNTAPVQEYESYETLPKQLGRVSAYGSEYATQNQFGMTGTGGVYAGQYTDQYGNPMGGQFSGAMYGDGMMTGDGMYAADGYYGYGQGMYGYGACPPMYSNGMFSGIFSHFLCSNAWENLTVGIGGSAFKSPLDFQNGGAFGFTETLNWATPSTSMMPVSLQAGVRAVQAYPSGYRDDYFNWHRDSREQYFGTVGVFKRNICCSPVNFGVAYDVMSDRYYDKYQLEQLRSELSYGTMYGVDFGYRGAFGLRDDSVQWRNRQFGVQVINYHTLFIRKYFANGGEGSLAGGATDFGDIMVRAEYSIPLSNEWGLKNSFSYIVPQGGHSPESPTRESWDVSLQLVYQPRGGMLAGFCNPFRSFFDVADNGTMQRRFK